MARWWDQPPAVRRNLRRPPEQVHDAVATVGIRTTLLFDIGGRLVATMEDSHQVEGTHAATWNTTGLAQGCSLAPRPS